MKNLTQFYPIGLISFIGLILSVPIQAQNELLSYEQVYNFSAPRLTQPLPQIRQWIDEDHYLETRDGKIIQVNAKNGKESVFLDPAELNNIPSGMNLLFATDRTDDYQKFLFSRDHKIQMYDRSTQQVKLLLDSGKDIENPRFSPDGNWIAYTHKGDLYALNSNSGKEIRLTEDGSSTVYNGYASWVYFEEILGRRSNYSAFWWSPDNKRIAFLRFDDGQVPEFPIYRADGPHGELEIMRYPKSGDPVPGVKLGIAEIATGDVIWIDQTETDYIAWPFWTPDGSQLFYQWMNRGQDELKIFSANPQTGKKKEIYSEKQEAWVEFFEDIHFLPENQGFIILSDKSGWAHLYHHDMGGKLIRQLTDGEWQVNSVVKIDAASGTVYFSGTQTPSTETHLFRVSMKNGKPEQLSKEAGTHRTMVSPGGKYIIDSFSSIAHPTRTDLLSSSGKLLKRLGDSKAAEMDRYALGKVELFTIPSGDGYDLPAVWTLPPDFDENKRYPVLFTIYGGPGSGTVRNSFRSLNDHYLAQHGIIVISVDHRGSGHFGKKGKALMHRELGKWEMHDLIAAVKWLREKPFIKPDKIGITGGSYGGYVTCMALTYGADYFTHGIARSSVTDWDLYDNVYTERYMDTPEENPEGYKFGAVMTHIPNYKGHLLITHGTADDNVHMQNTIQFVDAMTDQDKDFELMLYPDERHGIRGAKGRHATREGVNFWLKHLADTSVSTER